jgi:pimeloyl-ACP methyl ester carboxylesterase
MDKVTSVDIPLYFFTGRYDYCDPYTLTEEYFAKIQAPEKHLVWFENSAHFPFLEEPEAFAQQMKAVASAATSD